MSKLQKIQTSLSPLSSPSVVWENPAKIKFRRRAFVEFLLWMLIPLAFWGFYTWVYGWREPLQERRLEQLQVIHGEYYVRKYYRGRAPEYETGLKDLGTRQPIFAGQDALCRIDPYRHLFANKPATIWYTTRGAGPIRWIYQIEVSGSPVCTLDQANAQVHVINARTKLIHPWFDIGYFVFSGLVSALVSYIYYRKRISTSLAKEEQV